MCTAAVADTGLQQGQRMHGNFSRADTMNFQAAIGPDFKAAFVDDAPTSNADIGRTVAHILGLKLRDNGRLLGQVIEEALPGGDMPAVSRRLISSQPSQSGLTIVMKTQRVGTADYFDVAGFLGRTVGLESDVAVAP
jgi:hypothetical protein